ncbi:MAG: ribosome small subunit-dependent GTPase A [Hyphomicrobiales bacterium]
MTRDYSKFLMPTSAGGSSKRILSKLDVLGWQPFFAQQTSIEELAATPPVRVTEVHRNGLHILGENIDQMIQPLPDVTVGDWLLLNQAQPKSSAVLERKSLIKRRAPGSDRQVQLIAANVDTAFIVSSCNQDFNIARLERYIALAFEAGVSPVIVLTKTDLCETPETYVEDAQVISELVPVIVLDARGVEPGEKLSAWCKLGQTVAFLGSSGVGKSTLTNALSGTQTIETQGIREDDAKGRHTTTRRQLHLVEGGCAVLDTPGMRELQLTDASSGVADVFSDLQALSEQCRFTDCQHETEPGCAIFDSLESGEVDAARLVRWRKLLAEERFNTSSLAERKAKDKALGKTIRQIMKSKKR